MLKRAERVWQRLRRKRKTRGRRASKDEIIIQLYRGYRTSHRLFLEGRVLENEGISVSASDRKWRNFVNAIRRFESDEVAGATVEVQYRGQAFQLTADVEGYLKLHAEVEPRPAERLWESVTARIESVPYGVPSPAWFEGEVAYLSSKATYAVVTDIDDTLLETHITSLFKLRALYHTLVDNAHTRLAFPGAPELYRQLHDGPGETQELNPIFYLSRSPWNLYDMLQHFLDIKGFPKGPIFLRDIGLPYQQTPPEFGHKEGAILRLIEDFPQLKFICIGDSGEKDADIYNAVAHRHPDRIAAVVIRNVKNNRNAKRIQRMFERKTPGQPFYLVRDSADAARRLASLGFLSDAQVQHVADSIAK